jgi:tetratricopeptide (TPR) repeat protein
MAESESGKAFLAAVALMQSGDTATNAGDHKQAVVYYEKAIAIAQKAPGHDWDQRAFLAACHAVLSGPLLTLGQAEAGLRAADTALEFYDRHGHFYPAEQERWFGARRNKAVALSMLQRFDEALPILEQAKAMLSTNPEAEPVRESLDAQIADVRARASRKEGKPWWRF